MNNTLIITSDKTGYFAYSTSVKDFVVLDENWTPSGNTLAIHLVCGCTRHILSIGGFPTKNEKCKHKNYFVKFKKTKSE